MDPASFAPLPVVTVGMTQRVVSGFASAVFTMDSVMRFVLPDTAALHVVLRCNLSEVMVPKEAALVPDNTQFTLTVRRGNVENVGFGAGACVNTRHANFPFPPSSSASSLRRGAL